MNFDNFIQELQEEPSGPFWGLLGEYEKPPAEFYDEKYERYAFLNLKGKDYFGGLESVARDGVKILCDRTPIELTAAAKLIQEAIDEQQAWYVEDELEQRVQDLVEHGGWELKYLREGALGTEDEIRDLLKYWSAAMDEPSGLPGPEDLASIDALRECIGDVWKQDGDVICVGPYRLKHIEVLALVSLMLICQAVHTASNTDKLHHSQSHDLIVIGKATVEVLQIYRLIELLRLEAEIKAAKVAETPEVLAAAISKVMTERAASAANKRHKPMNNARRWVEAEWRLHRDEYKNNKSDFSRTYVKQVLQKFEDSKGDPLSISEKTIKEVWLKDNPDAGK